MFFYEGLSCPHCHRHFKDSDDIVACPVCGAPHHRGCWVDAGGCACKEDHGTDKQWTRDTAQQKQSPQQDAPHDKRPCPYCGGDNSPYAEFCAFCGREIAAREWHSAAQHQAPAGDFGTTPPYQGGYTEYAPFHVQSPFGGVSPDADLGGETARDVAAVVRTNTAYYMPRFERITKNGSKVSWNWAAFLIPTYWLLHRKQYIPGILMLIFDIVYMVVNDLIYGTFTTMLSQAFNTTSINSVNPSLLGEWLLDTPVVMLSIGLMCALMLTRLLIQIGFGLFGNYLYLHSCVSTIRKTRNSYPEGYQAQLQLIGGTSLVLAMIGYMCIMLIPQMILLLIL